MEGLGNYNRTTLGEANDLHQLDSGKSDKTDLGNTHCLHHSNQYEHLLTELVELAGYASSGTTQPQDNTLWSITDSGDPLFRLHQSLSLLQFAGKWSLGGGGVRR